jgi:hypothetical protein
MQTWASALALVLLSAAPLRAQALPPDSLFDRLIGRWVLAGTIARRHTTHDVTFEWMLGREYVQMHEVSRERAPTGTPAYEAVVMFGRDPRSGEYACLWMDNTAATAFDPAGVGRGSVAGDSPSHSCAAPTGIRPTRSPPSTSFGDTSWPVSSAVRCSACFGR